MTENEMLLIRDIFWDCGETLVCFDERTDDKKLLFVTKDEPTMLQYIITSPIFTDEQKEHAELTLEYLMDDEDAEPVPPPNFDSTGSSDDERVLYSAPNFGLVE